MEDTKITETKTLDNEEYVYYEPAVDLCFMLDCTGSMSSYIQMSCNKIKDIIRDVNDKYPKSEIRIGLVAYRDIGDQGQHEIHPFNKSADAAKEFLGKLTAHGGGDTPEDINGAFQKMLEMDWQSPVRLVVHIADAPCHGKNFHDCDDSYPTGYKGDMDWNTIFERYVEKRLDYLFLKISNITDKMFDKFKELAVEHGANRKELRFTQELANGSMPTTNEYGGFRDECESTTLAGPTLGRAEILACESDELCSLTTAIHFGDEKKPSVSFAKASKEDNFAENITNAIMFSVQKEIKQKATLGKK